LGKQKKVGFLRRTRRFQNKARAPTPISQSNHHEAIQHPTQITKKPTSSRKIKNCGNFPKH
jgi:hypothetical protein